MEDVIWFADDQGNNRELPTKYKVCPECKGYGVLDNYVFGLDRQECGTCHGNRVISVVDEERANPEILKLYRQYQKKQTKES